MLWLTSHITKSLITYTGFPLVSLNIVENRSNPNNNQKYWALGIVNVSGTMKFRTFSDAWKKYFVYLTYCMQVKNTHVNLIFLIKKNNMPRRRLLLEDISCAIQKKELNWFFALCSGNNSSRHSLLNGNTTDTTSCFWQVRAGTRGGRRPNSRKSWQRGASGKED